MQPLFSLITPAYNCKSKLEGTLKSILEQDFGDFEYLIIDGNSQDGSQEWFKEIKDPRVRAYSEPDKGIYDAMNKGVRLARGRFLYFLGAGDALLPGVLRQVSQYLPKGDIAMIYGDVSWEGRIYDGEFSKLKLCYSNICHQAIFYGKDVFKIAGDYNLKYRLLADWAFNMRCFGKRQIIKKYIPVTVSFYEANGASSKGDPVFTEDRKSLIWNDLGKIVYLRLEMPQWRARLTGSVRKTLRPLIPKLMLRAWRKIRGHS